MHLKKDSPYKIIWEPQAEVCKIFNFLLVSSRPLLFCGSVQVHFRTNFMTVKHLT